MIRNIIWDVDGTLFDTYPAIVAAVQAALKVFGCSAAPERIIELSITSLRHCALTLAAECEVDPDQMLEQFSASLAQVSPSNQPLYPGVIQVCELIMSLGGLNLIATHRSMKTLSVLLEHHRLDRLISACLCAQDGWPLKPDPAMFNQHLSNFNLLKTETLAVGDRDIDIQAGCAAGLRTCGYRALFLISKPDFIIQDYQELIARIKAEK